MKPHASEAFQELDEIGLLFLGESQQEPGTVVVTIDDGKKIGRAAIVEVRRVLPERAQRGRPPSAARLKLPSGGSGVCRLS
jgi:hypothetical protein